MVLKDKINENGQYKITDKSINQIIRGGGRGDKGINDEGDADVKEDGVPHAKGLAVLETS